MADLWEAGNNRVTTIQQKPIDHVFERPHYATSRWDNTRNNKRARLYPMVVRNPRSNRKAGIFSSTLSGCLLFGRSQKCRHRQAAVKAYTRNRSIYTAEGVLEWMKNAYISLRIRDRLFT